MRMLMVRIFLSVILVLAISCWTSPRVSFAEDVWVYSRGDFSFYLPTEQISVQTEHPQYRCVVKKLYKGKYDNFDIYGFVLKNGRVIGYHYGRNNGYWEHLGRAADDPMVNAVWQAMKPYLKQKGVKGVESWN